ncbi:MAG: glycoside hydrolase family 19 protein [Pseudomonadota bacterium]
MESMCISRSVGHLGRNKTADVKMIQTMLNLNRHRYTKSRPAILKVDGRIGNKTIKTIRKFERVIMGLRDSDALITDHDPTLQSLQAGLEDSPAVDKAKLQAFMPHALPDNIERYRRHLRALMPVHSIDTPLRIVHFLAQLAHESGSFRYAEELASGAAYEGRSDLGNTRRGDGKRFKGRGLIQLTGRANYQAYSDDSGIDYVAKPKLLATDAKASVDVACWFWSTRGLNTLADADDVRAVTRRINGGYNGIDDRIAYLKRAKCLMRL